MYADADRLLVFGAFLTSAGLSKKLKTAPHLQNGVQFL